MKLIQGNFSIELEDDGDIVIGKDGQKAITIKNDGTIEFEGSTGIFAKIKSGKWIPKLQSEAYSGSGVEAYPKINGQGMIFAGKTSDNDSIWFLIDFDARTTSFVTTEPA